MTEEIEENFEIDTKRNRYPYCIVWTPIPIITWLLPWIGHMGIATSRGIIRDFAGPYFVAEDNMAFGNPTKYWQLDPNLVDDGKNGWDEGVEKSSILYCKRMVKTCEFFFLTNFPLIFIALSLLGQLSFTCRDSIEFYALQW